MDFVNKIGDAITSTAASVKNAIVGKKNKEEIDFKHFEDVIYRFSGTNMSYGLRKSKRNRKLDLCRVALDENNKITEDVTIASFSVDDGLKFYDFMEKLADLVEISGGSVSIGENTDEPKEVKSVTSVPWPPKTPHGNVIAEIDF